MYVCACIIKEISRHCMVYTVALEFFECDLEILYITVNYYNAYLACLVCTSFLINVRMKYYMCPCIHHQLVITDRNVVIY